MSEMQVIHVIDINMADLAMQPVIGNAGGSITMIPGILGPGINDPDHFDWVGWAMEVELIWPDDVQYLTTSQKLAGGFIQELITQGNELKGTS